LRFLSANTDGAEAVEPRLYQISTSVRTPPGPVFGF
jgi:hypothetical protein